MEPKTKGNIANHVKRQAKKIKKEMGISHHQALDIAASNAGFSNWKNVVNSEAKPASMKQPKQLQRAAAPIPQTLSYYPLLSNKNEGRPNAKMPINAHQELGVILKRVREETDRHKRIRNLIDEVRFTLDEWIQREYTSKDELLDEVFFKIYYGDLNRSEMPISSPEHKKTIIKLIDRAKLIISIHYPPCKPVDKLNKKLVSTATLVEAIRLDKRRKNTASEKAQLPPGTVVYFKSDRKPAIVIRHNVFNGTLECYANRGPVSALRAEMSAYRDQAKVSAFMPQRLKLPYGKWTCADGSEVMFNRDYCPIWVRTVDGKVETIDPDTEIIYEGEAEYCFHDGTAPWYGKNNDLTACLNALSEWGVENRSSKLMKLLATVIRTGDTSLLKPNWRTKEYPAT